MENDVKDALRRENFSFKKRLGQNFITDKELLASIARRAGVSRSDVVVEIGCGAGTLTAALAERAKRVVSFEVDKSLKPVLERTLAGIDNVEVVFRDFLKTDLKELEKSTGAYSVVANIPYYVTTPIITKIIEESELCSSVTVTVQQEVAERLCAREGTPEYGAITAAVALYGRAEIIMRVPREAFTPRPNVDSAVVKIVAERDRLGVKDVPLYKKTVRAAFLSRRKTLENNLVSVFGLTRGEAQEILSGGGIEKNARGETLSPEALARLSERIGAHFAAAKEDK